LTLDLHRHAVLEASAGTGKTHTIGELVLRLIHEEAVPLERILIVTFTEKATGELKSRLRSAIEQELDNSPPHREVLQAALDGFDQAWIFTLHGFCRRILQEYPIEQGQDLRSELVDDAELLEPCLRELQRRTWRQEYGDFLDEVLEISGYDREQANAWEERVLELAGRLRPDCGDELLPAMIPDWPVKLAGLRARLQKSLPQIRELLPRVVWNRRLKCLKAWAEDPETYARPLKAFHKLYCETEPKNGFAESGFPCLLPDEMALFSPGENGAHADAATALVSFLEKVHKTGDWSKFRYQLAVRTVHQLQRALADFKGQHGQWSFQDMIARVEAGLDPAKNPRALELAGKLRERFRCGIVDEFQDTDPLQWRILRRIFLAEGTRSPALAGGERLNGLMVVGDPKQAIFGFRGADLPTYLAATTEMLDHHQAQEYPLLVNWRSTPEMLRALNRLFAGQNWFPAASLIGYRAVDPPDEEDRPNKIVSDRTGRAAVNVVDWTRDEPLSKLRRQNAQFIVREIERLLAGGEEGPTLVSIRKAPVRPMNAGDICILVFRRSEARPLLAALSEAGIPYSFYKQPALWQSEEAKQLRMVLEALHQPEHEGLFRKALLTRFFRISAQDLALHEDLPARHPARQLFENWLDLAARRQWAALFQSLLEDTGLLFDDVLASDADRFRANYRHLTGQLVQQAYGQNLDLLGLVELCGRLHELNRSDENLQPKETEQPRVQITTIHASKGLEFPIVFLAGGWTEGGMDKLLCYRDNHGLVYDLTDPPSEASKQLAAGDDLDEARRLLYVALTRAMFKLYVPIVREENQTRFRMAGPLVKLLAPALNRARLEQMDFACAAYLDPSLRSKPLTIYHEPDADRGTGFLARPPGAAGSPGADAGIERSRVDGPGSPSYGWRIDGPLFPSLDADLSRPGIVIRSFTSLHRAAAARAGEGSSFATESPRVEDEEIDVAAATVEQQKDPLRGAVFGEIVHGVLEKIDFDAVGQAPSPLALLKENSTTEQVLAEEIDFYLPSLPVRLPEDELRSLCRQRVADLVWRALRTPLAELGGPLCQVEKRDRLHELQFHFPEDEAPTAPALVRREENFITGFIDLVVRRERRYFLLDWKTNVLPSYGPEDVSRAMEECDYHLQYRLYLQALSRWLRRSLGPTFDENRDLGGVYYLFLRGMTGQAGTDGVFFHKPASGGR